MPVGQQEVLLQGKQRHTAGILCVFQGCRCEGLRRKICCPAASWFLQLPKIKSGLPKHPHTHSPSPQKRWNINLFARLLEVRRMFSLLYYLHILAQLCTVVKSFFELQIPVCRAVSSFLCHSERSEESPSMVLTLYKMGILRRVTPQDDMRCLKQLDKLEFNFQFNRQSPSGDWRLDLSTYPAGRQLPWRQHQPRGWACR